MKPTKLINLIVAGLVLPSITITSWTGLAIASPVKVKTANVEAVTRSDGSVYVNSGRTTVKVPSRRSHRYWNPIRYWRFPWQSYHSDRQTCRHSSYQSTSHVTQSSSRIVQSSVSSHTCN